MIRDGLKRILGFEPDLKVIGEAANGEEAVRLAAELSPRVILMDINMPVMNGIQAARLIKEQQPQVDIIALTIHDDEEYVFELINSGISGYILKDVSGEELVDSIDKVVQGETVYHPNITQKVIGEFRRITNKDTDHAGLTPRELEVLAHVARGDNNKEIAEKLYISERTVKNHLTCIFRKLNVKDRTRAALYALKNKIVKL